MHSAHAHVYMYVYMCTHRVVLSFSLFHTHMCVCTHAHACVHTHTHMCMCTHTHTHTPALTWCQLTHILYTIHLRTINETVGLRGGVVLNVIHTIRLSFLMLCTFCVLTANQFGQGEGCCCFQVWASGDAHTSSILGTSSALGKLSLFLLFFRLEFCYFGGGRGVWGWGGGICLFT